jgi:hypothetical protein
MTRDARPLFRLADDLTTLTRSIHDAGAERRAEVDTDRPHAAALRAVAPERLAELIAAVAELARDPQTDQAP